MSGIKGLNIKRQVCGLHSYYIVEYKGHTRTVCLSELCRKVLRPDDINSIDGELKYQVLRYIKEIDRGIEFENSTSNQSG